jgi:hypothetical protein
MIKVGYAKKWYPIKSMDDGNSKLLKKFYFVRILDIEYAFRGNENMKKPKKLANKKI